MRTLVFISLEYWDEVWRRNQFLAARMQRDFDVTFVGPELPITKILWPKITKYKNIRIKYIFKLLPEKLGMLAGVINNYFYKWQLGRFRKVDVLWINDHSKYFLEDYLKHQQLIYDITDDWTLVNAPPKIKAKIVAQDRYLCERATSIIVCSKFLFQKKKHYNEKLFLVPNGINIKDYALKDKPGKFFLYTGTLHQERLDVPLVISLAKKYPKEKFVFVGPVFFDKQNQQEIIKFKNIVLMGAYPYAQLSGFMAQAKALLVPHLTTDFVNSLDPIKQYEYMLSAKPVIATKVSGFADWRNIFTIVSSHREYLSAVGQVLAGKLKVNSALRRKIAHENTWDKRYNSVRKILKS